MPATRSMCCPVSMGSRVFTMPSMRMMMLSISCVRSIATVAMLAKWVSSA